MAKVTGITLRKACLMEISGQHWKKKVPMKSFLLLQRKRMERMMCAVFILIPMIQAQCPSEDKGNCRENKST